MKLSWAKVVVCVFAVAVLATIPGQTQVSTGTISGVVTDSTGAVVPNAQITARNAATGATVTTKSQANGNFRVALLPPGTYDVRVEASGFRAREITGVVVNINVDRGLGEVALDVGSVTETVTVEATPPLMVTTQAQVSSQYTGATLSTTPGAGEGQGADFLALFTPGVSPTRDQSFSNSNGASFSSNGSRGRNNDQQIDGQNNNDNSVGGPYIFMNNPDWIAEYQIVTSNFNAEYGRNTGSVVNIVTQSGSSAVHGTVFDFETTSDMASNDPFDKRFAPTGKSSHFNTQFFGGTIGGPIVKDKVFFFGGFDSTLVLATQNVFTSGALTPTPAGLATLSACFPGSTALADMTVNGPYGIKAGNPTPVEPGLTTAGVCPGVEVGGISRTLSGNFHEYEWMGKVDFTGVKHRFSSRYIYENGVTIDSNAFGTAAAGVPANVPFLSQDIGLEWTWLLAPTMTNQMRFSYGRLFVEFGTNSIGTLPGQAAVETAHSRINFASSSVLDYGPASNAPQGRIVNTTQWQDNWALLWGRHAFKAGFNHTWQRSPNVFLPALNGVFNYGGGSCTIGGACGALSNFANNLTSSVQVAAGSAGIPFHEQQTFLYFQDDIRIRPNLTLVVGLTWSFFGQPSNLFNDITVARESGPGAFWDPSVPLDRRTFRRVSSEKDNFGPSIGFAYTPRVWKRLFGEDKTVIRGGYRRAFDPSFYNIHVNIASSAPIVFLNTLSGIDPADNVPAGGAFGPLVRTQLDPFLLLGVFDPGLFSQTTVEPDFGAQRAEQWSLGIQREITPRSVLEVRYVGNHAYRLFQSVNANPFVTSLLADFPTVAPAGVAACPVGTIGAGRAFDCNRGRVRSRNNSAFSNYHSLQSQFRADNIRDQLTLRANYTWSHTTDNVSEIFGTFGAGNAYAFSQNPFDFTGRNGAEYGNSGLDFRHTLAITFAEQIPFFRNQQGAKGKILGGWGVSGTYYLGSGQPYTPVQIFTQTFSSGNYTDSLFAQTFGGVFEFARPYVANPTAPHTSVGIFAGDACAVFGVGCALGPGRLISFNAVNAIVPTAVPVAFNDVRFIINGGVSNGLFGTPFGNAGRNILRNFQSNIWNLALLKNTRVREGGLNIEFRMTLENAFNHPNWSSIDPFIEDAGLSDAFTGWGDPKVTPGGRRIIRFGLKFLF